MATDHPEGPCSVSTRLGRALEAGGLAQMKDERSKIKNQKSKIKSQKSEARNSPDLLYQLTLQHLLGGAEGRRQR